MTDIAFGPAEARPKKVIGGVAGPTGSGKTMSALEIGTGLVADPSRELFLIDTEFGRGAHYANAYAFQYGQLSPPFTPQRYQEAIEAAVAAGAECVIVDSLSHMWEGEGGAREQAFSIAQKMAARSGGHPEKYSYMSWNEPKEDITKFVLYMQRCAAHLVLCLRAKEKSKMVRQDGGKSEIVNIGLQPIMEDGVPYECTFLAMLDQEQPGVPRWTHKALASYLTHVFPRSDARLSREHGKRLAEWAGNVTESVGAARSPKPTPVGSTPASGATKAPQPSGEHADEPAATTAAGPVREKAIADAFKAAPTIEALNDLEERRREEIRTFPRSAQSRLSTVFHEMRAKLMPPLPAGSFADDMAALEPDEWKNLEGRDEDERQGELMT